MGHIIYTYQCEWKTTIEDTEKMKRFRHFINSDKTDNKVVFFQERDQIRPATKEEEKSQEATETEEFVLDENSGDGRRGSVLERGAGNG